MERNRMKLLVLVGIILSAIVIAGTQMLSYGNDRDNSNRDNSNQIYKGKITLNGNFIRLIRNESSLSRWINFTAYENDSIVMTIEDFCPATEHVLEIHLFHKNYNDTVLLNDHIDKRALGWFSLWNTSIEKDEEISLRLNPTFLNPAHLNTNFFGSKPTILNPSNSYWFYFRIANLSVTDIYAYTPEPNISFYLTIGIERWIQ